MNLLDSSFLCIDIGSSVVRALGMRVSSAKISTSAVATHESNDTVFALRKVIDELAEKLGCNFDSAFTTGNLGNTEYVLKTESVDFGQECKISETDVIKLAEHAVIETGRRPLHIIPLRYDLPGNRNIATPVGQIDTKLSATFGILSAENNLDKNLCEILRRAHLQSRGYFDPTFLLGNYLRNSSENSIIIDLGANQTTASIWTARGPIKIYKIPNAGFEITKSIATNLNIPLIVAERIKRCSSNAYLIDTDRFVPADSKYDFSKADVNEIFFNMFDQTVADIWDVFSPLIEKYNPTNLYLVGGGCAIQGIDEFLSDKFKIPTKICGADTLVQACAAYVWDLESGHIKSYTSRKEKLNNFFDNFLSIFKRSKKINKFIPVMPSTLAFNMIDPKTYAMFLSGGISMIHCDIMDGFYVDGISGSIDEIKTIRANTTAHLHVHLMTESPIIWAENAAKSGADTIILSTGTFGVRGAIKKIKELGKRAGLALHPETPLKILTPILRELDEVLIMSVIPGSGGQEFITNAIGRISALANTRKKHNLNFKISVDGGINPETAKLCWAAGADFLVSGTYLSNAVDFPLAVQSLTKR